MGMYTDFCFDAQLKANTPNEVISFLQEWKRNPQDIRQYTALPEHELFRTPRWWMLGFCCSAYFDAIPHFKLEENLGQWVINIRCNLKNYDDEIDLFVEWIKQYVDAGPVQFLGFKRYEEETAPTLFYM